MSDFKEALNTSLVAASRAKAEGFEETAKALLSIARQFSDHGKSEANREWAMQLMHSLNSPARLVYSNSHADARSTCICTSHDDLVNTLERLGCV